MGMSKAERDAWKQESVDVPIDHVVKQTKAALIINVDGDYELPVGMSVIENLEELQQQLRRTPENQRKEGLELTVPRWLAIDNGWEDDEPPY